jgi:hypothetical protein
MAKTERNIVSVFRRNAGEDLEISLVEVDGYRRLVAQWRLFKPLVGEPGPMEDGLCYSLSVMHLPKLATALVKMGAEARARVRRSLSIRLRWFAASIATIFVPELAIAAAYMAWLPDVRSMRPTPLLSPTPRVTARGILNLDGSDAGRG